MLNISNQNTKAIKKILYTGSTGSLGKSMPKNENIVPLFIRLQNSKHSIYEEIKKHKANCLIHFAAIIDKVKCEKQKKYCYNINVKGSKKLFQAAIANNIDRFIYVSTSEVYGSTNKLIYKDINFKTKPENTYGKMKLEAENELIKLAKKNTNIKLSIARIFSVTSNDIRPGSLEDKIHNLAKEKKIKFIDGLNKVRDFSTSKDICKSLIKLSQGKNFPKIVNICSEKPTSLFDFVNDIYKKYNLYFKKFYNFKVPKKKNYLVGKKSRI